MNVQRKTRMAGPPVHSYAELLAQDPREAPPAIFAPVTRDLGTEPVPASNYTSAEFFAREADRMWMRTWQMACLEAEIPNVGDTQVYELLDQTAIIVRQRDGTIRAFKNVCRHRGRKLVDAPGCKTKFRCAYHGLTWSLDGRLVENPFAWDFPQLEPDDIPLLPVRCETWAGFVFVNFDMEATPLLDQLAPMPAHFEHWQIDRCYRSALVGKVAEANWKVCAEAFIEGHHVICTHPEYNLFSGYDMGQHDVLSDHVTRFITPSGVTPGPFLDRNISDTQRIELMLSAGNRAFSDSKMKIELDEGVTSRTFTAQTLRKSMAARTGYDFSEVCDADMVDGIAYDFFPAFHLWGGFKDKISYRFRPLGPERTLMEVMLYSLGRKDEPLPPPAKLRMLAPDEKWTSAPELGALGPVYEQDFFNMGPVQAGLRALGDTPIHFSKYLEVRCRNLHRMVGEYMAR